MESREVENFHVRETTESTELGVIGKFINQTVDVSDRLVAGYIAWVFNEGGKFETGKLLESGK